MEFERKIKQHGQSKAIILPPDVAKYLDLEVETEMLMQVQEGKYGKYLAIWRKDQNVQD